MKKSFRIPDMCLILIPIVFYIVGLIMIKPVDIDKLKDKGYAEQEEFTYFDSDGDEHEGETLISVSGLGKVLVYKDIYLASTSMLIIAYIIGAIVYRDTDGKLGMQHIIFANCILGLLLIWLTSKANIIPTILFWLGIISADIGFGVIKNRGKEKSKI